MFAGILRSIGSLVVGVVPLGLTGIIVVLTTVQLGAAISDVVADAMVAERAKKEPAEGAGNLQSLCWVMLSVGAMMGSILSSVLLQEFDLPPKLFFVIFTAAPMALCLMAFRLEDTKATPFKKGDWSRQNSSSWC